MTTLLGKKGPRGYYLAIETCRGEQRGRGDWLAEKIPKLLRYKISLLCIQNREGGTSGTKEGRGNSWIRARKGRCPHGNRESK